MGFLQKAVMPARENAWLTQGDELIAGYVVAGEDAAGADTPEKLFRLHGLGAADAPLSPRLPFLDVVRFPVTPFTRVTAATEVPDQIVPLWWIDPVRVPAGAELWRVFADGHEELVAAFRETARGWVTTPAYAAHGANAAPSQMLNVFGTWQGHRVIVDDLPSGRVAIASFEPLPGLAPTPRGVWAAEADAAEVTDAALVRFSASWNGLPVQVLQRFAPAQGGFVGHIVSLGRDAARAESLGLTRTEAGVYEATVPWDSLTDVQGTEVRPPAPVAPEPEAPPAPEPAAEAPAPGWVPVEQAAQALSPGALALVPFGQSLWARLAGDVPLNVIELAGGWGICLVHAVRGGGKIYVAPDGSALFAASAAGFDEGLAELYAGRRTPIEQFHGPQG